MEAWMMHFFSIFLLLLPLPGNPRIQISLSIDHNDRKQMSQQPKEEAAAPAKGDASSSPALDFSGVDFSKPEACLDLKEEHYQCFHVWLAKFDKGEAQTDECKPSWERYRACTAVRPIS
jgi:hypothetical protein